jgi:large subunit ribosomal protein L15
MRLPKRGFRNPGRIEYACVNVDLLDARFEAEDEVTLEVLQARGIVKSRGRPLKILGRGALGVPLAVRAQRFTAEAKRKIEDAGGTAEEVR